MSRYLLNIKTHTIHDGDDPCYACRRAKTANLQSFDDYDEAVNYFEGEAEKGIPCGICMKQKDNR